MARILTTLPLPARLGNLTVYKMEGKVYARKRSSLTRRTVKNNPEFARTRQFAVLMGQASKIGSTVFKALPAYWRESWMYRSFTGEAMQMLRKGMEISEVEQVLMRMYVDEVLNRPVTGAVEKQQPVKRTYIKRNARYWRIKTVKAGKRQNRRAALAQNASLMGNAAKIASRIYGVWPGKTYGRIHYQKLTGLTLQLLRQGLDPELIKELFLETLYPNSRRFSFSRLHLVPGYRLPFHEGPPNACHQPFDIACWPPRHRHRAPLHGRAVSIAPLHLGATA